MNMHTLYARMHTRVDARMHTRVDATRRARCERGLGVTYYTNFCIIVIILFYCHHTIYHLRRILTIVVTLELTY